FLKYWRDDDRQIFEQWLKDAFEGEARTEDYLTPPAESDGRAAEIALTAGGVGQAAAPAPRKELNASEQELLWRIYLVQVLRKKAGGAAAVSVLPAYHELPEPEQRIFKNLWRAKTAKGAAKQWLQKLGFSAETVDELTQDPDSFSDPKRDLDLAWRVHLHSGA